jgi:protein phosphatase
MHALRAGDRYLLCSDGLNGMLDDAEIAALLGADATPQSRVQRLIDSANARGGRDNVTVAIADVLER